ncbi:MAG: O-antigen ligase family protein, partial [Proteobacteria bacterium]|nr:O-antigen ligase family protein [Pseudomonadota bacterium]
MQAATAGILGYANVAGLGEIFSMYGRASGTFRDPNVLGPFLVLPALYLLWDIFHGGRYMAVKSVSLVIIVTGLFLSFSRGAWGSIVVGAGTMIVLAYYTSEDRRLRNRVVKGCILALVALTIILTIALSIDDVAQVFADRFVLQKDYDSGPSGRFGNQKRSIPELLVRPFGYGPNRHGLFWPENPHNV